MLILPVTHHPQQQLTDCLPACAKMLLDYYHVRLPYQQLQRILKTTSDGTPFNNLTFLAKHGLSIVVANEFDQPMALLEAYIGRSVPVILSVDTAHLPYWIEATDHAVVVVGINDEFVALFDPWFPDAPKVVERVHVESAWLESAFLYCAITKVPVERRWWHRLRFSS